MQAVFPAKFKSEYTDDEIPDIGLFGFFLLTFLSCSNSASADGIVRRDAPMIYHSDEGVEHLAREANLTIDWSKIPE
jgi:hypothetical protein